MTEDRRTRTRGAARAAVLERTGGRCYLCGRALDPSAFDVDHVHPLAAGGAHAPANVAPACPTCNRRRGARGAADPSPAAAARVVAARLAALGIRGAMLRPRAGPAAVAIDVRPAPGYVRAMLAAGGELGAALGRPVRVYQHGAAVRVELARWTRPAVTLASLPPAVGQAVPLGLDAVTGAPVGIDLSAAPHVLIAGQTNSGKSTALRTLAYGLAAGGAVLALADSDADTWRAFKTAAALAYAIAGTPADVRALVLHVAGAMPGRDRGAPPLVLMLDEAQTLDATGRGALADVLARGRKHGVHVVLATQYVRADVLDRRMTDQAGWRIAGRVSDPIASRLILGTSGAEALTGAGDMLVARGGGPAVRMLAAMPTPAELAGMPRAARPPAELEHAHVAGDDGPPALDPDVLAWATARGPDVSARAIRMRWRMGQDAARRYRDAARSALTDRLMTDRAGGV